MKISGPGVLSIGVIVACVAGALLAVQCARQDGIAIGKQLEHDDGTDRVNAARATADILATVSWRHEKDSLKTVNAALARQLARQAPGAAAAAAAIVANPDTMVPKRQALAVLAENVLLRGVIAQDTAGIRARDVRILALEASVLSYADTIVPNLTRDRDKWKRQALRARTCGLGGAAGYGVRGADAVIGFTCRVSIRLPLIGGF